MMTKDGLIFEANSLKQGRLQALTRQQLQAQATQNRERRWGPPTFGRPGSVVRPQRPLGHGSPAPRPMPPAGNWVPFACSVPPLFVLSHSLPTVNTMGKLASFGRFSITVVSASSISLATDHYSHAPRHPSHLPPAPAGSGRAQTRPLVPACNRPPNW